MTQYLGPQSLLNSSFQWLPSLLTQCMLQNLNMRTVHNV
nr:MAG TPA: hypothetical protein [Caudoviricetes sp.]